MLLYFSMFTLGFWAGAILAFRLFAAKKPEEEEKPATFVLVSGQKNRQQPVGQYLPEVPVPEVPVFTNQESRLKSAQSALLPRTSH